MSTTQTPTSSCSNLETTDLQISANIANAVKILIGMLQDGTIPVKNSSRLQNLTIEDIVKLATSKIKIPDIRNHIVTNENNEITNIIEEITNYNIIKDTKFVQSDYIKFKFTNLGTELVPEKYIEFHLPKDLYNKDRIVSINLTTKNDDWLNLINNDVLFDYTLVKDPNDNQNRYLVTVPANKLELGSFEYIDINNLPTEPSRWGTYGIEKFIKVTYLVDTNWTSIPSLPETVPGNYDVIKNVPSAIIPMTYGIEPNIEKLPQESVTIKQSTPRIISFANSNILEGINNYRLFSHSTKTVIQDPLLTPLEHVKYEKFLNEVTRLISQKPSFNEQDLIIPEKTFKIKIESKWIIAPMVVAETIFDSKTIHVLKNPKHVIKQSESNVISNIIDNVEIYNAQYAATYGNELNETIQILIPPSNKIINPLISQIQTLTKNESPYRFNKISNKIIDQIITKTIDLYITEYPPSSYGETFNQSTILLKMLTDPYDHTIKIKKYFVPNWVIEQIITKIATLNVVYKNKHSVDYVVEQVSHLITTLNFARLINKSTKIISLLSTIIATFERNTRLPQNIHWLIEQDNSELDNPLSLSKTFKRNLDIHRIISFLDNLKSEYINQSKIYFNRSTRIINQEFSTSGLSIEYINPLNSNLFDKYKSAKVISQGYINEETRTPKIIEYSKYVNDFSLFDNTKSAKIIQPKIVWPATMVVSSGSISYLRDLSNIKMLSSLATNEEFIPFYTGEDNIQRNTYEFIASDGQRVFDITTNPYDTTIYREGIRLSRGDYYVNGYKVILKSPANSGETITVVSERKYTYSNTVSKEELENAIGSLKAERPILTYPAMVYELGTAKIIIENYNPGCIYDIAIRFNGSYRDDIAFVRNGDTIYLDIPEIINIRRTSIDLIIYATLPGRIQSIPTSASILIKNLYDYTVGDLVKRYVVGVTPAEWLGQSNIANSSFDSILTSKSQYTIIPEDTNGPARIGIVPKSYIQSKIISFDNTTSGGSYLDTYVGLENLNNINLPVLTSTGTETIFNNSNFTQLEIEEAFKKNTLWFIVDGSTENNINSDFINALNGPTYGIGTYGKNIRYNFRPAQEFMTQIHLLPRTADSIMLEHIDKLKNRFIKTAIILDLELRTDYDFTNFVNITEEGDTIKTLEIPMESIEYKVQENVPHLLIKINNDEIQSINNPYVNAESKVSIKLNMETLNSKQFDENNSPLLQVNNMYAERIFSGLRKDMKSINDEIPLYKLSKFKTFDLGNAYQTDYKSDYFVIEDEDFCNTNSRGQKELYLGMIRYQSAWDNKIDNSTFKSRIKTFDPIIPKPRAIRALVNKNPELYTSNSPYVSDFALVQYGGMIEYIDGDGNTQEVIDNSITFQFIYIKDSFNIYNSLNPINDTQALDGFHVINGPQKTIKWSNIWDTVFTPSIRTNKAVELNAIWTLLRDNQRNPNDQRWLNLTDGILCRGKTELDNTDLIGSEKYRDLEVINNEDGNGFLIFGGIGYKPVIKNITNGLIVQSDITKMVAAGHPDAAALQNAYNRRKDPRFVGLVDVGGWLNRTDRLNTRYGWENGEPYIEFSWAKTNYRLESKDPLIEHWDVVFYIDRISRSKVINQAIYFVDTTQFIDTSYTLNHSEASHLQNIFRKLTPTGYNDIYKNNSTGIYSTNIASDIKPIFYDIVKEGSAFWLTIKQAGENTTKLFKLSFSNYPSLSSGSSWEFIKDLFSENDNVNQRIKSKWTMTKDGLTTIRGDGPMLIKHVSIPDETNNKNTIEGGIYYYDTWDKKIYKKVEAIINTSTKVICIPEIPYIRNPYFLAIDSTTIKNYRLNVVGSRLYLIIYLDKYISTLTKDQFNMFKESIIHLQINESSAILANPLKSFTVLPNDFTINIRTIIPNNDDYRANSAQIIFNRMSTQSGLPAENLVFRLTNTSNRTIELDSVRFITK